MRLQKYNDAYILESESLELGGKFPRWHEGYGVVTKYVSRPGDYSAGIFTATAVSDGTGTSAVTESVAAGKKMLITTAAGEYDGINLQLKGESFKLTSGKPLYAGFKLSISAATQSDIMVGLLETDTAPLAVDTAHGFDMGTTDGALFAKFDASTTAAASTFLDGVETATADYGTDIDTSETWYEMYWDGTTLYFFINGNEVTSTSASLPDGDLTPTVNFRTGAASAITSTIVEMVVIQAN